MEASELEKLINGKPDTVKAKGILLFNAVAKCTLAYRNSSTSSNLRDMNAAEAALNKFKAELEINEADSEKFKTLFEVLDYLADSGWKATKTSLYRHQKEGKILPQADGTYLLKDVDKYAKAWLPQLSTGKRLREKTDEMQRKKLDLEIKNLEIEQRRKALALDKEQGKYIPREQMELEMAARAGVLEAGLKHLVQSRAAEWIRAVGGDMKKVGDLINTMNNDLDEHINSYASQIEYQVVIEADRDAEETEP